MDLEADHDFPVAGRALIPLAEFILKAHLLNHERTHTGR